MFNLLVTWREKAWETDQLMRIDASRFGESSGADLSEISVGKPETLKVLEGIDSFLMYEMGREDDYAKTVKFGHIQGIKPNGTDLAFRFIERGRLPRLLLWEYRDRLGIDSFEFNRTHWAVKDGGILSELREKITRTPPKFDIVLSFAGENRPYVEQVAEFLKGEGVSVFYDFDYQASLWGKELPEHLDAIYRGARHCVVFVSEHYARKIWPNHERRSALARQFQSPEYVLPVRLDSTEIDGIRPSLAHMDGRDFTPAEIGRTILEKLRAPW